MQKEIMEERAVVLVSQHLNKYPEMRIADVYKLLYHACMGAGHAISNRGAAEDWLLEEWGSITENPDEKLYENISLHHPIFRINLRPAKARNIAPSEILDSFIKCGNEFPKNPAVFRNLWEIVSKKIRAGTIALPGADKIDEFDELVRDNEYPAMHHSREYAERYRPAYRAPG